LEYNYKTVRKNMIKLLSKNLDNRIEH